jgi:hypothetical protein
MEFKLYDILLNVFEVDEAEESDAKIENRFIVLSTPNDSFKNLDNDKFLFDFWRDDTFKNHSSSKVNTRIRIFNERDQELYNDYFANIGSLDYLTLLWRFKKHWIQNVNNLMWLTNLLVAVCAIVMTTYITLKVSQTSFETQKIEHNSSIKLDEQQLQDIIKEIKSTKNEIDSMEIDLITKEIEKNLLLKKGK